MGRSTKLPGAPGLVVQGCDGARPKQVESKGKRWSDAAEARFLQMLAATCNVRRAADAAGFSTVAIYQRRLRHRGFAERWAEALETGYARLELAVVEAANDTLSGVEFALDHPIPRMSVKEALLVLQLHKATVKQGLPSGSRWRLQPADPEKARLRILKKVAAVRRRAAPPATP